MLLKTDEFDKLKAKRYFHRILSGQKLAAYQKKIIRFVTFTTSDTAKKNDISRDIDVLIKRIRRIDSNFQYWKINTNEGNGVIHLLYKGKYITHDWLVYNWNAIHNSYIVDIRKCDNDLNIAAYLVNQYLSNQNCTYTRMSYSKNWIFPGAVKVWRNICLSVKNRYYYNSIQMKYYKNKIEVSFNEILSQCVAIWNQVLYSMTFKQTLLTDYG